MLAAGRGGVLLIVFINGGQLYAVDVAGSGSPYPAPVDLFPGASNPSIAMSDFGKAYVAFTAIDGAGTDVRAAFYETGSWSLEPTPLNLVAADDAGTGTGRPRIAVAGDGVAIVVWGEGGHLYSRRVWGVVPSTVDTQVDPPSIFGWNEVSAADASVGSGNNSTYADVTFDEVLADGQQVQSRVIVRQLFLSEYAATSGADGLATPDVEGADEPAIATDEYNQGLVTAARQTSNEVFATLLGGSGGLGATLRVDSLANASAPYAVPAGAALSSALVAWQRDPGSPGIPEIRARYFDGSDFGDELVLSSSDLGPTDAARGLLAAGDISGDVAVAWVQGVGDATQIVTGEVLVSPGSFGPSRSFAYANTQTPVLSWSAAHESWGAVVYRVSVNGTPIAQTTGTSLVVTLPQGPASWQVTAVNAAGLTSAARAAEVWVDSVPPAATLALSGRAVAGGSLHAAVSATDAPPPVAPADASGIASITINWGDGSLQTITSRAAHVYVRSGPYTVTVTVRDHAGNVTTLTRTLRIAPKPKPKPKVKSKSKSKSTSKATSKPKVKLRRGVRR